MNLTDFPDREPPRNDPNVSDGSEWGLQVTSGPPGEVCQSFTPVFRIGRSDANDLVIPDHRVSRFHAFIRQLESDHFELVDLGSTNGTHVNGRRITGPTRLSPGQVIVIGETQMTVQGPSVTAPQVKTNGQASRVRQVADGVLEMLGIL